MPERYRPLLILITILCCAPLAVAEDAVPIETVTVAPGIYMLLGNGGNVAVSVGDDAACLAYRESQCRSGR